jgi:DNA-binding winged helix-turn-helix (wHTH) protein
MLLPDNHFYRFGEFTVDTDQKVLLRAGQPVHLTPKVFDTLLILVENHSRIVGKEELMTRLWPDTFVEETNLTFNIQQLRKALGDRAQQPVYIETVARRGYRFIADVEEDLTEPGQTNGHKRGALRLLIFHCRLRLATQERAFITGGRGCHQPDRLKGLSKKSVVLAAVAVIVLAGAGIIYWSLTVRLGFGAATIKSWRGCAGSSSQT